METLIMDPRRKGQPFYKGHFPYLKKCTCNTLTISEKDSLPTRDKMTVPKCPLLSGSIHCTCISLIKTVYMYMYTIHVPYTLPTLRHIPMVY